MLAINGRVVVRESGLGVANVMVFALNVPGDLDTEALTHAQNMVEAAKLIGSTVESLGSHVTDANGRFSIDCTHGEGNPPNREKPNLLLIVATPERADNRGGTLLHVSPTLRTKAGAYETFLLQVDRAALEQAGLIHPFHAGSVDAAVASATLAVADRTTIRERLTKEAKNAVAIARNHRKQYRKFEETFVESISRLPKKKIRPELIVNGAANVEAANKAAVSKGLSTRINGGKRKSRYYFTAQKRQAVEAALGVELTPGRSISFKAFRRALMGVGEDQKPITPQLIRQNETIVHCLNKIREEAVADHLLNGDGANPDGRGPRNGGDGPLIPGRGGEVTIADGLPKFVAHLVDSARPPEQGISLGGTANGTRPTQDDVQKNVGSLQLAPGPADQPSFFDFHTLQIAFDHVWKELISQDVLDHVEALHKRLTDLGGDLDLKATEHQGKTPFQALRDETIAVETTLANQENPGVMFAIKDPELIGDNDLPGEVLSSGGGTIGSGGGQSGAGKPYDDKFENGGKTDQPAALPPPNTLLNRLRNLLNTPYAFTIFAADEQERSVNFGILVTYRQKWEPIAYQAGELVKTIPLAPKETRRVAIKKSRKQSTSRKEIDRASSTRRQESSETSRAEDDIVSKARAKTNFNLQTKGTYDILLSDGTTETTVDRDSESDSQETKKDFREAVFKAAQEWKNENVLEINEEITLEEEETTTAEISNPNEEIAVTYLFYELQRRYRIHEEIHRITPVVLVAQEVPDYSQITDAWLIAHDWVLKRVLLDDSFRPALDYLATRYAGDKQALFHLAQEVTLHRKLVNELKGRLKAFEAKESAAYEDLQGAIAELGRQIREEKEDGAWNDIKDFFGGGGQAPEAARVIERGARDALERAAADVKDMAMRLEREVGALQAVSERYQKVLEEHNNWQIQIERLKLHVKDNILYYMQGIWVHEVPDQRYFRLFQVKAPHFDDVDTLMTVTNESDDKVVISTAEEPADIANAVDFEISPQLNVTFEQDQVKSLVEVADLDKLLGFKGNYAIFPLKESNPLTDIMMDPFVNAGFGQILSLFDPDESGNLSRHDFAKFVVCLHETLGEEGFTEEIKEALKNQYERILLASSRPGEELIVSPRSPSLFVEALPATHPLLEDFKLLHRQIDVMKEMAATRHDELENVRLAARLLESKDHIGLLEDAEIERKVIIAGKPDNLLIGDDE